MEPDERQPAALTRWHDVVRSRDPGMLADLLAEDAVFHSPVVHRPQQGRDLVMLYLMGAMHVLANDTFHYVREVVGDNDAVLEFVAEVDGVHVNGVDMIAWDTEGRITDFKVMLRPLKAIHLVKQRMAQLLESAVHDQGVDQFP
jgi:hypothetical protein